MKYNKNMHTDEYQISLNREIGVCRKRVSSAKKELDRLEKIYGLTTEQALGGKVGVSITQKELVRWKEEATVFSIWSKRLREYEELYLNHKR